MAADKNAVWALRRLLLAGDGLGRPLAGAGVGVGALTADRQALAVTQTTVAAEIHQPLDIDGNFTPQIAFDHIVTVDHFTDLEHFLIAQLRYPAVFRDVHL